MPVCAHSQPKNSGSRVTQLSACLLVVSKSDYRTPKSHPEISRWAWGTHPCLQVEKEKTDFPTGTKYYPRPLESPLSGIKKHSLRCNTPLRCISRPCNQSHTPYFLAERSTLPGGFDCCRPCKALCFIYFLQLSLKFKAARAMPPHHLGINT